MVSYELDEDTTVQFEIEPSAEFRPASPDEIAGRVREAVAPAVEAARAVLDKVRATAPDEVKVKFGVKVSGIGAEAFPMPLWESKEHIKVG